MAESVGPDPKPPYSGDRIPFQGISRPARFRLYIGVLVEINDTFLALGDGFEPPLPGSEPGVLPLDDPKIFYVGWLPPKVSNLLLS